MAWRNGIMATAGSIVDSKALAMIAKWNGDKDSFKVWQFDILAYVGQHCPALREKMLQIPLNSNPVDVALLSADETKLNAQLFYAFTLVTEGAAKVTLMNCPIRQRPRVLPAGGENGAAGRKGSSTRNPLVSR